MYSIPSLILLAILSTTSVPLDPPPPIEPPPTAPADSCRTTSLGDYVCEECCRQQWARVCVPILYGGEICEWLPDGCDWIVQAYSCRLTFVIH